jgi:hypothetical protein
MIVKIDIDCDTWDEVFTHLSVIRHQIRKSKKKNPSPQRLVVLEDDNCYGSHMVRIKNFGKDETV